MKCSHRHLCRQRGLSLIEVLIAMVITALLLTATMAATHASFLAYADAAEQASAQTATRMVVNRLMGLIRASTAHGPLLPSNDPAWPVTIAGNTLTSRYFELLDANGNLVRVEWRQAQQQLWLINTPTGGGAQVSQPLISGVTNAVFTLTRTTNDDGLLELSRGTLDITVQPGQDTTLALETGHVSPIRVIASTMPRKLQ